MGHKLVEFGRHRIRDVTALNVRFKNMEDLLLNLRQLSFYMNAPQTLMWLPF